jgi:hypothetical protein
VILEGLHHLGDGRLLLADGDVHADHVAALLVDDRVDRQGGLAGLPVANDQLALAPADGNHRVDGLQARLHRLLHRLTIDDAGGDALDRLSLIGLDGALAVDRPSQGIDHPPDERLAGGHGHDPPRAPDLVAFLDLVRLAQEHRADRVLLQVQRHAEDVVGQLQHLEVGAPVEAVNARDAVAHRDHAAHLGHVESVLVALDRLADDLRDLVQLDVHGTCSFGAPTRLRGR